MFAFFLILLIVFALNVGANYLSLHLGFLVSWLLYFDIALYVALGLFILSVLIYFRKLLKK